MKLAKLIFKARSQTLDIKTQRTWKYSDNLYTGCNLKEETGQQILVCDQFNDRNITSNDSAKYSDIYSENVIDIVKTGKILRYNLTKSLFTDTLASADLLCSLPQQYINLV